MSSGQAIQTQFALMVICGMPTLAKIHLTDGFMTLAATSLALNVIARRLKIMASEIDTTNKFLVSSGGDDIVFLRPLPQRLNYDDALLLAAYIVAMVADSDRWEATLTAVESA